MFSPRLPIFVIVLLTGLTSHFAATLAQPQINVFAPVVSGHLSRLTRGENPERIPVSDARIEVFLKNNSVLKTTTDDEGAFRLETLPVPASPSDRFVVVARPGRADDDLDGAAVVVAAGLTDENGNARPAPALDILLRPAVTRTLSIVAVADKKPIAGATVNVLNFRAAPAGGEYPGNLNFPSSEIRPLTSDANGDIKVSGVPAGASANLRVRRAEYADNIVVLRGDQSRLTVPLSLETRVYGVLTLDGGEPLGVPQWRMKMQGWKAPWNNNWRMGDLNARGEYVIENVATPAVIGEATYGINLDLHNAPDPRPGVHADYVPPSGGWDVLVTVERDGQKRRYISYVEGLRNGLKFDEGTDVRHDIDLQPMAVVKGTASPGALISYANPRSIYGRWRQQADADGRFEIYVPTGDITLQVGDQTIAIEALGAHETRTVTLPVR